MPNNLTCKYESLTAKKIEDDNRIEERAKTIAAEGLPIEKQLNFSQPELNAVREAEEHYEKQISKNKNTLATIQIELARAKEAINKVEYADILQTFKGDLSASNTRVKLKLRSLLSKKEAYQNNLRMFKLDNNLARSPKVRSPFHFWGSLLLIVFLLVAETWANGRIMGPVLPGGFNEGFGYTITIAIINVFGSFAAALFLIPCFIHVKAKIRRWAYAGFTLYLLLIGYINLAAGVFRGIAERALDAIDPTVLNLEALLPSANEVAEQAYLPWNHLDALSFQSQLFMGMGLIFAMISIVDGYFFDDPYLGYGTKGRAVEKNTLRIEKIKLKALQNVTSSRRKVFKKLKEIKEKCEKGVEDWGDLVDNIQDSVKNFTSWILDLTDACNHAIACFQDVNLQSRTDGVVPYYFKASDQKEHRKSFSFKTTRLEPEQVFQSIWSDNMGDPEKEEKMKKLNESIKTDYVEMLSKIEEVVLNHESEIKETIQVNN